MGKLSEAAKIKYNYIDKQRFDEKFKPLRPHPVQYALSQSTSRFNVVPSGRRSGKTEIVGKRRLIARSLIPKPWIDPRYFVGAPTRRQVKDIYWNDLKIMTKPFWRKPPSESELKIFLQNGTKNLIELCCLGMDEPARIEGSPWDGGVLDEIANMKPDTWTMHVEPVMADRFGWCDFIGVPEGRNHYYKLAQMAKDPLQLDWEYYHWTSETVLLPAVIEAAKRNHDPESYEQEYKGSFLNFQGLAYYPFDRAIHTANLHQYYNKQEDLIFCFDFNVSPGVAAVIQETVGLDPQTKLPIIGTRQTSIIGEVWIPRNSNTRKVCDRLIKDWGSHQGEIVCYGDFTGGSKGSAKVEGSDWDLIQQKLYNHYGAERVDVFLQPNPPERTRVNSVNSRLLNTFDEVYMMVDPNHAPNVVNDFEGVCLLEGGSGEIDKDNTKYSDLTHLTDAIGYHIYYEYPIASHEAISQEI